MIPPDRPYPVARSILRPTASTKACSPRGTITLRLSAPPTVRRTPAAAMSFAPSVREKQLVPVPSLALAMGNTPV